VECDSIGVNSESASEKSRLRDLLQGRLLVISPGGRAYSPGQSAPKSFREVTPEVHESNSEGAALLADVSAVSAAADNTRPRGWGRRGSPREFLKAFPLFGRPGEGSMVIDSADISASVYKELRRIAAAKMKSERNNHTLQPTALVHEAYMRLAKQPDSVWKDRGRILGLAAHAMRNILVDHARARATDKRGAGAVQVSINNEEASSRDSIFDVLVIHEALTRLEALDARQANILELHFFAGLALDEIAQELSVSPRTVARDWAMARAWLRAEISGTKHL